MYIWRKQDLVSPFLFSLDTTKKIYIAKEKHVVLNDTIKTSEMHFSSGAKKWRERNSTMNVMYSLIWKILIQKLFKNCILVQIQSKTLIVKFPNKTQCTMQQQYRVKGETPDLNSSNCYEREQCHLKTRHDIQLRCFYL